MTKIIKINEIRFLAVYNRITSGQRLNPVTGGIPRERKQELVKFKWRQYSLDGRSILWPCRGLLFMDGYTLFRFMVGLIPAIGLIAALLNRFVFKGKPLTTRMISRVALFGSISAMLYILPFLKFSVPFFPGFLEIHFDEIVAMIAGFAYGPLCGFLVILVKTIIKLPFTSSLIVGELCDLIYGSIMVVISAMFYKKNRSFRGAITGIIVAMTIQVIASGFITTFLILDFYIYVMGFDKAALLSWVQAATPHVHNLTWDFFFFVALPFNAFKDVIIVLITLLLYKRTKYFIEKARIAIQDKKI